jgi:hypothetical protein
MKTGHQEGLHWQAVRQKLNTHSVFKKLNKNCYGPNGIDYPRVKISEGSVSRANITYAKIDAEGNISVLFDGRANETEDLKDQFFLYVFCPDLRDGRFAQPVTRSIGEVRANVPSEWQGHLLHLYAFMKDSKGRTSETIYVGLFHA